MHGVPGPEVDPPPAAKVVILRPELMTAAQIFRKITEDLDALPAAEAPRMCIALVFHTNGRVQTVINASPECTALAGSMLQHTAVAMTYGPPPAAKT